MSINNKSYKRQYLWVSQDFYNWVMNESQQLRKKGINTGSAGITHILIHEMKLPEKINLNITFPKVKGKRFKL
jgi:hypothetical protein